MGEGAALSPGEPSSASLLRVLVPAASVLVAVLAMAGWKTTSATPMLNVTSIGLVGKPSTIIGDRAAPRSPVIRLETVGGRCDGRFDNFQPLQRALAQASRSGGTVNIPPGRCLVVLQPGKTLMLSAHTDLVGRSTTSELSLNCHSPAQYHELLRVSGAGVRIRDLRLVRSTACQGVMIKVLPTASNLLLSGLLIHGGARAFGGGMHGIELAPGHGSLSAMTLSQSSVVNLDFGLFQASTTQATTRSLTVSRCLFTGNLLDDLEFNAPNASMQHVVVRNSVFSGSGQFAIGLANVQHATLSKNYFSGFRNEPIHIEDRSAWINVTRNVFGKGKAASVSWSTMILVIGGSHSIQIQNNNFDLTSSAPPRHGIFLGPGGLNRPRPHDILIDRNRFTLASDTMAWANYGADAVTVAGNQVVKVLK